MFVVFSFLMVTPGMKSNLSVQFPHSPPPSENRRRITERRVFNVFMRTHGTHKCRRSKTTALPRPSVHLFVLFARGGFGKLITKFTVDQSASLFGSSDDSLSEQLCAMHSVGATEELHSIAYIVRCVCLCRRETSTVIVTAR